MLNHFDKIWILAKSDLKARYSGSFLGVFWVFLKPFCIFLVLSMVFSNVFEKDANYSLSLLVAIILWTFFSESTMQGMLSLFYKGNILKKIYLSKWIAVVSSLVHAGLAFVFNLMILAIFLYVFYQIPFTFVGWGLFIFYIVLMYVFALSISFIISVMFVYFHDVAQIWDVLLQMLFFATPIIYPASVIPEQYKIFLYINPLAFVIKNSQNALLGQPVDSFNTHVVYTLVVLFVLLVSFLFFHKFSKNIVEKI